MIKTINYTLIITIISAFSMLNTNNLSAAEAKKCVCPAVKTIKNEKYTCKISSDGRCVCRKATTPVAKKNQATTSAKKNEVKKSQNKKTAPNKANKNANKKQPPKSAPKKTVAKHSQTKQNNVKSTAKPSNKASTSPKVASNPTKASPTTAEVKKITNPLIIVNRFEEDPTFLASITGILYGINEHVNIIDVANIDESKDLIVQAYKLLKTSSMWGKNAIFISGSSKIKIEPTIIIVKSKNNQFFVTQNSGVITFIKDTIGIAEVRKVQRVNFKSETLNGRDVEYLIGAKLIDNPANFDKMGEKIDVNQLTKFNYTPIKSTQKDISSLFVVEDRNNGNIFTFIPSEQFNKLNPKDNDVFNITLSTGNNIILEEEAIYKNSRTYFDGTEAIILDYKSSIGTYIAIKNLQNSALSTLQDSNKNYKVEITPVRKGAPVDISKIENTDSATQNVDIPLDEEKSQVVPYSTKRTTPSDDIIREDTTQNAKEANIKDLQKNRKPIDTELPKQEKKSLTDNETKSIYPSAGRNNLDINSEDSQPTENQYSDEVKELDKQIKELESQENELQDDQTILNSMIDEDLENENTPTNEKEDQKEGIKGISSTNSYIDEEDGVLISKLASNNNKKTLSQDEINSLEAEKAITSKNSMTDNLVNQNTRDIEKDNQDIHNIEQDTPRGPESDSDAQIDESNEEFVTGIRKH